MIKLQQFLCVCFSRSTCRLEPRESSDHSKGAEQNGRAGPVGADRRLVTYPVLSVIEKALLTFPVSPCCRSVVYLLTVVSFDRNRT